MSEPRRLFVYVHPGRERAAREAKASADREDLEHIIVPHPDCPWDCLYVTEKSFEVMHASMEELKRV